MGLDKDGRSVGLHGYVRIGLRFVFTTLALFESVGRGTRIMHAPLLDGPPAFQSQLRMYIDAPTTLRGWSFTRPSTRNTTIQFNHRRLRLPIKKGGGAGLLISPNEVL